MGEPRDHVRREPLPWQRQPDPWYTECGRKVGNLATISHSQWELLYREWAEMAAAWRKSHGSARPPGVRAPNVCQVCWDRARYYPTFREDPLRAMQAAIERGSEQERGRLFVELRALGVLYRENSGRFTELFQAEWDWAVVEAAERRGGRSWGPR
jgi:hypothetical protein